MNRLQNLVLVLWGLVLLLFVAFNWQMVWKPVPLVFFFVEFEINLWLWLAAGGFCVPLLLRMMGGASVRRSLRRADKEIHLIKAKAFDSVGGELEKLVKEVKDHVDLRISSLSSQVSSLVPPPAPESSTAGDATAGDTTAGGAAADKDEAWRALAGASTGEGEAADGAASDGGGEDEAATAEKKPARKRKSKA